MKVCRKRIKYNEAPNIISIANYFNTIIWIIYGYQINNIQIKIRNGAGCLFSLLCIWTCLIYLGKEKISKALFFTIIISIITFSLYLFLYIYINNPQVTGVLCIISCILAFISPTAIIIKVFKTKNYKLIPIVTALVSLVGCICWSLFGLINIDFNIVIPNFIGIVFALIQTIVWKLYKKKRRRLVEEGPISITTSSNVSDKNAKPVKIGYEGNI